MRRSLYIAVVCILASMPMAAQSTWGLRTSVGTEKKIGKGLDAGMEFNYYQADNFKTTDRWNVGLSLSKRLFRNKAKTFNVKAGLGYKYLNVYQGWNTKYKGDRTDVEDGLDPYYYKKRGYNYNFYDSYVDIRHRVTASLQATMEFGKIKVSLRESYQFTHSDSLENYVMRFRYVNPDEEEKDDKIAELTDKGYSPYEGNYYKKSDGKSASDKNLLRSRISVDYNIPHWKYDPFVSYELFNSLDKAFEVQKSRITAGVDFSFNKKHNFEVAYMWQNQHDDDEPAGSFICVDYKFTF